MITRNKNKTALPPLLRVNFEEETIDLLISRTYYLFMVGSILYPAFWGLDWFTHPDKAFFFLYIRLAVGINFFIGALLIKLPIGKKIVLPVSLWCCYVSLLAVSIMAVSLDGFFSNYYIGIVLLIFIPGLFLPWNFFYSIMFGFFSIASYFILNLTIGYPPSVNLMAAAPPFFFMTWSFFFMVFANVEKEKTRCKDFMLRMQIEKANEELKELDKTKMRFFSNVSHELRTPLTLIIGPLEELLQSRNKKDPIPLLRAMEANAHRLLRQVNTILDFSKADVGKLACYYSTGNLGKILSELVNACTPYAKQKKTGLNISGVEMISDTDMDIEKVETIAANLISNALKFTPGNGHINICTGKGKSCVWFEVQDTGIGIPEDKLDLIFERFLQVDDQHSRHNEGTGLGLAMVKELVLLHGGNIDVHSEIGKGSTFRVELPMKAKTTVLDRREKAGRRKSDKVIEERMNALIDNEYQERRKVTKRTLFADVVRGTGLDDGKTAEHINDNNQAPLDASRLLVVEDNPDLRAFIVRNLIADYQVEQAENGRMGLDLARRMNPDLIISDVMMPEMDGYEFCEQIRKDPFLSEIPIILATSKSGGEAVETGLDIGATDYISKPFEMRELKARIATQLKNRSLEKNINERETRLIAVGQMTNTVVHDLKTPLNTIMGFTQIAQQDSKMLDEKEISKTLGLVMESCTRLNRMISEILDFASGYAPELNSEPIVLVPFLETTLGNHREKLETMEISLVSRYENCDDTLVEFDSDQMHRVVNNLIINAKERFFTDYHEVKDKIIWVTTRCDKDHALIRFSDNGSSIPEEVKASLFEPFTNTGKKSGPGLGFATVRNIISAHSGKITFESNGKEGGAVFELKFPIRKTRG